jgi:uncharacterized protein DUF669
MSLQPSDKRPKLRDIVRGSLDDFKRTWDTTEASAGFAPLPAGTYRCLVASGELFISRTNATPGYKITFDVIAGPFSGRKVWHDLWLTSKALGMAKGDLERLGITRTEQLEQPLPAGLVADVVVIQRTEDDGTTFNRVKSFKVIDRDVSPDDFAPDDEHLDTESGEGDDLRLDSDGFDWSNGDQITKGVAKP